MTPHERTVRTIGVAPGYPRSSSVEVNGGHVDAPDSQAHAFPPLPLHDYAFLGDGERGALVGPRGEVAWMCAPRWHDPPVFASLIGAGLCAVTPLGARWVGGGHYEDGSLIWCSRWVSLSGRLQSRDALARPAHRGTARLLRHISVLDGSVPVRVILDPRLEGGEKGLEGLQLEDGVWQGRLGPLWVRCSGLADARVVDGALVAETTMRPDGPRDLVIEIADSPPAQDLVPASHYWKQTEAAWREDVPQVPAIWARRDVRQSFAVLSGMTSAGGGMVAAATRSLPERAEQGRDYDYRFSWIRDQAMVGQAVASIGPHPMMESALDFVGSRLREDGAHLRPAYTVDGAGVPPEGDTALPGYPGAHDHSGNRAGGQFQLDVFGEALHLFAAAARHGALSAEDWRAVIAAVEAIRDNHHRPDAGIWELDQDRWAHSRLMLVSGLRAICVIAPQQQRAEWEDLARHVLASVESDCLHPSGRWQRAPRDTGVDSALLIPVVRASDRPAWDARARITTHAILASLTEEEFCYRFHGHDRDMTAAEGAFILSGFHMAMALERLGEHVLAARWFERNRAACGAPGLFCEEYDVVQRQQRGNLPQAFVHGALIETAALLSG